MPPVRHAITRLNAALSDTPVVLIHGLRQCGKSTLAKSLCNAQTGRRYITFDDPAELLAAKQDPRGYIERLPEFVVLDEVQRAPEIFVVIKLAVDERQTPGRFLLTGSADVTRLAEQHKDGDNLQASPSPQPPPSGRGSRNLSDSLSGRMEIVRLWPLSQGEIDGAAKPERFIDRVFGPGPLTSGGVHGTRDELIGRILRGGFPEAVARAGERRTEWFDAYTQTITERDIRDLAQLDRLLEVPRLLALLATRPGTLLNHADIARDLGMSATTARRHMGLLETVFQAVLIPAWSTNLGLRLTKSPKAFLGDTGLAAALADLTPERLNATPTLLGPLLENFVAIELLKQTTWAAARVNVHHYRTHSGQEVDVLLEDRAGRVVGVEIKASKSVTPSDFRHLRALRSAVGERFHRGMVMYTGERVLGFGEKMEAVPVGAVWEE